MSIIKRIFFLCLLIFFMTLLLWGVYNLSFKGSEAPKTADNNNNKPSVTSPKTAPTIAAVSDEAVIAPAITQDGMYIKYYSKDTGKIYQIDLDGKSKNVVLGTELKGLNDVIWSPDRTKAITKFIGANGQAEFYSNDYTSQKETPIKKNTDEMAWQSNSSRIFYKYYDSTANKRSLNVSDPDGTNWTKLTDINYRNISISQVPQSGLISFWNKPDAMTETIFQSMPIIGGDTKTIMQGKFGADYLWSPDGNKVLMSNTDSRGGSKMQLAVINSNGGEYRNLDMPTMVTKCAWSKDVKTIFCALPGNIPSTAIMPNEYEDKKITSIDTFWKIDAKTGKKERLVDAEKIGDRYDVSRIFLNSDESLLFFVNRLDGKIYRINL